MFFLYINKFLIICNHILLKETFWFHCYNVINPVQHTKVGLMIMNYLISSKGKYWNIYDGYNLMIINISKYEISFINTCEILFS